MNEMEAQSRNKTGQSLVEFALILPILLLLVLGIFEFGRLVFVFGALNNASREAARFGAASGVTQGGSPAYLNCDAIRQQARDTAFLTQLADNEIDIAYDAPGSGNMVQFAQCGDLGIGADDITLGDRVVVTITHQINPILGFLPSFSPTFVTARTIMKNITIGAVECQDGVDNDGDGNVDFPDDDGCESPDDTTEAFCYRLSVVALPPEAGTLSLNPGINCSNRYIEDTIVNLQAFKDIRLESYFDTHYTFDYWEGLPASPTSANPTTITMDSDQEVIAHFRLLTSDLSVTKSSSANPVLSLTPFTYTISVSNLYSDTARMLVVTDTLPAGIDYRDTWQSSHGNAVCNETVPDSQIVCTLDELAVGATVTFDFGMVSPPVFYEPETLTNTVTVSTFEIDPNLANNTDTIATLVLPRSEISMVEKTDSVDSVYAETPYDYSISVSNGGPSPATGVMVTDVLSTGLTFVSSDICSYDTSSRTVSCPLGEVSVLATEFVTFTVLAPPDGSLIFNVASVSANEAELNPGDNSASEETLVVPHADLSLSKSAPPTVYRDSLFEYTLTASNLGPSIAENVILTDALPGNVAYEYSVNAYGSCSHNSDNHTVTCTLGEIPAGSSREIKIIVTPTSDGPLLNTATITSNTDDLVPGNNGASATSNAVIDVNLSVEKTYSPEAVAHGDSFSYAIVVRNSGLSDATAVNVVDTLPDGVAFDSLFAPPGWSCSYNGSTEQVSCQPDSGIFSSGNQATINIEVTATEPGQPTNSAILSAAEGSDSDSVTTDVDPKLDLSVELGGPISVTLGSPYSYTLTVANSGPSSATNVRLASELDPDVSFVDVEALSGNGWLCSYEASQHRIGCSNSTLPAGAQANFVITVRPENDSLLLNQGEVSANESGFDTNSGNDYDSFVTDVD